MAKQIAENVIATDENGLYLLDRELRAHKSRTCSSDYQKGLHRTPSVLQSFTKGALSYMLVLFRESDYDFMRLINFLDEVKSYKENAKY